MPLSANVTLRNFGLTIFLAQIGLVSGPQFVATVQQLGPLFLALGAAIILYATVFPAATITKIVLVLYVVIYGKAFLGLAGSYAIRFLICRGAPAARTTSKDKL